MGFVFFLSSCFQFILSAVFSVLILSSVFKLLILFSDLGLGLNLDLNLGLVTSSFQVFVLFSGLSMSLGLSTYSQQCVQAPYLVLGFGSGPESGSGSESGSCYQFFFFRSEYEPRSQFLFSGLDLSLGLDVGLVLVPWLVLRYEFESPCFRVYLYFYCCFWSFSQFLLSVFLRCSLVSILVVGSWCRFLFSVLVFILILSVTVLNDNMFAFEFQYTLSFCAWLEQVFNLLISNLKLQILLCYCHTLLIAETGRICSSVHSASTVFRFPVTS